MKKFIKVWLVMAGIVISIISGIHLAMSYPVVGGVLLGMIGVTYMALLFEDMFD